MSCVVPNKTEEVKTALRKNKLDYEEMRQRLLDTEKKLQNLNRLEAEIQHSHNLSSDSQRHGTLNKEYYGVDYDQDDLESIPSAISTVPGSYQGFNNNHIQTSTPSRLETNNSQNNQVTLYSHIATDTSSVESLAPPQSKYDLKLLKQNQRLLSEVERLVGDIHLANQKNADLVRDAEKGKRVVELEEKCASLSSENIAQEKKLREAERHLVEGQRRLAELQKRLSFTDEDLVEMKAELSELRLVKKELESQRDEALHNLNSTQDSLEDYQKKTKEKMLKMEEKEDRLRENLTHTSQERDDLLDQLSTAEMTLASQEAQISRLLNDVTDEDSRAQEFEAANQKLKTQLDLLTAQLSDMEKGKKENRELKKERDNLKSELKSHRTMASDLKSLLKLLQKKAVSLNPADDSGNFSFKSAPLEYGGFGDSAEGGLLAAELNCNNNGLGCCEPPAPCEGAANAGKVNMMCEMRNLVTNMDGEIQRLRCDLKQRDADDRTYANLRDELKTLMDKVENGMCHNRELECQVQTLECDKTNLRSRLEETLGCLEERDRALQCLETRLNERSVQIVCLQEDIDERNCRISALEAQVHDLNKRLREDPDKDKPESPAMKEARARIQELEAILTCKNKSLDEMGTKLSDLLREARLLKSDAASEKECLTNSLSQRDAEIQSFKDDVDTLKAKQLTLNKLLDDLKTSNKMKEDKISCLQREVEEAKFAAEKTEKMLQTQLDDKQKRLKACQDQCMDLEAALCTCRNEVCNHLKTMDDIRAQYEGELEQRDSCIRKLKEDLRCAVEELKCKMEDNNSLERSLAEARNKVHQICAQLKESDTNIQCLNIKLTEMEKQSLKEKSNWMKESEEAERRLAQCCNTLNVANTEIDSLRGQVADKKNQIDCMQTEKTHMCQEIKKLNEQVSCLNDQIKKMELDNQELCRQLQQKMECIRDLENVIRTKDHELKCLTKYVHELEEKQDNGAVALLEAQIRELTEKLTKCQEENKCKSTMLCECEEAFKACQFVAKDKDSEIALLKCQIDNLNERLTDRISRVDELERGIENLHKDVERRMSRVDEQLKKYETELADRIQEIATLKECVTTCQLNMSEKSDELHQQEQKNNLLASELQSLIHKLKDAEDTRDHLNMQLAEKKGEVTELTQQLRINREQMQKQHEDLVQCRQALSNAQRDCDKLRRELDDSIASLEHRECEITRLNDERKCLMEKVASISCQMEQDTGMLRQQLMDTKCRLEKELECLRNYSNQVEGQNASLSNKLSLNQRQMMQMEKCFHQKLDTLNRNLDDLGTRLKMRDDELMACRDCIGLKESEVNRLKKRLCSAEKVACNANCHNNCVNEQEDLFEDCSDFQQDEMVIESVSHINLADDPDPRNMSHNKPDSRHWQQGKDQSPNNCHVVSSPDHSSTDSLHVTEVQERLRNNQMRQHEIERQLESLEQGSQDSLPGSSSLGQDN